MNQKELREKAKDPHFWDKYRQGMIKDVLKEPPYKGFIEDVLGVKKHQFFPTKKDKRITIIVLTVLIAEIIFILSYKI